MGKIFCVEFQSVSLKFHAQYLTHTLKDMQFVENRKFKRSQIYKPVNFFETTPH